MKCISSKQGRKVDERWNQFIEDEHVPRRGHIQYQTIFIKGLTYETHCGHINEAFQDFGRVLEIKILTRIDGTPKGYGFVTFESSEEALRAMQSKKPIVICGSPVVIGPAVRRPVFHREIYRNRKMSGGNVFGNSNRTTSSQNQSPSQNLSPERVRVHGSRLQSISSSDNDRYQETTDLVTDVTMMMRSITVSSTEVACGERETSCRGEAECRGSRWADPDVVDERCPTPDVQDGACSSRQDDDNHKYVTLVSDASTSTDEQLTDGSALAVEVSHAGVTQSVMPSSGYMTPYPSTFSMDTGYHHHHHHHQQQQQHAHIGQGPIRYFPAAAYTTATGDYLQLFVSQDAPYLTQVSAGASFAYNNSH